MENVIIYDNGEIKIEVLGWFDYVIKHLTPQEYKLQESFFEKMIPLVYTKLSAAGVDVKKLNKVYGNIAPIFAYGTGIIFKSPFDIFEEVQEFLCLSKNIRKDRDKIQEQIDIYNMTVLPTDTNIYFQIFDTPYNKIDGWFAYVCPEKIVILFWAYESPIN